MSTRQALHGLCLQLAILCAVTLASGACALCRQPDVRGAPDAELTPADLSDDAKATLQRLQGRFDRIQAISSIGDPADLAGRYTAESDALAEMIGGGFLEGSDLYLFRHGEFVYIRWADVEPQTIYGRGTWRFEHGVVQLLPEPSSPTLEPCDRRFLVFRMAPKPSPVRLGGTSCALARLEEYSGRDWKLALLMNTLERVEGYGTSASSQHAYKSVIERAQESPPQ
jgi:hypothetical protein